MANEVSSTTTEAVKKTSDGMVKITVEKYNELLDTIADQKGSISRLNESLNRLRDEPPVIHRTVVHKTPEMHARDNLVWGNTLMGVGVALFVVGAFRRNAARLP